jgi:uncharacterized protein (TIGR02466 family)
MHPNSAISGVYYVEAEKDDIIKFKSPLQSYLHPCYLHILPETHNIWNSASWDVPIQKYDLILFPSWLEHMVPPNDKATTDRISISFNTFVRGNIGSEKEKTELILK